MLIIRLQRVGKRNEPTFRVILTDSKNAAKTGKFLEILGSYDPRDKNVTKIDGDRVKEWMAKGAQVSDTVHNILINQGIIKGDKINVLPKKSPIVDEEALKAEQEAKEKAEAEAAAAAAEAEKSAEAPAEETPAPAEAPAEEAAPAPEAAPEEEAPAPAEEAPKEEEKPAEEPAA